MKDINSKNDKHNLVISVFSAKDNYTKNNIIKNGIEVEYKKEGLSQVNSQLYEWLATINDKSSNISISNPAEKVNTEKSNDNGNDLAPVKKSLSEQSKAPIKQSNLTYGEDIRLDTAPTQETVSKTETVEDILPDDYAPITEEEALVMNSERLESLTDADVPIEGEDRYYNIPDTSSVDNKTLKNIGESLQEILSLTPQETKAIQGIVQEYSTSEFLNKEKLFKDIREQYCYYNKEIDLYMKTTGITRRIEECVIITSQNCCRIKIRTILENIDTRFTRMR